MFGRLLLLLFPCLGQIVEREVAVILGGVAGNSESPTGMVMVEIFSEDSGLEDYTIPDLPLKLSDAMATYVPNEGIFVCGGRMHTVNDMFKQTLPLHNMCWKFNGKDNQWHLRTILPMDIGGIRDGTMLLGYPDQSGEDKSQYLWMLGGYSQTKGLQPKTYTLNTSWNSSMGWEVTTLYLREDKGRQRHCTVKIDSGGNFRTVVIGGNARIERDPEKHTKSINQADILCTSHHEYICTDPNEKLIFERFPSLLEARESHSCTVFNDQYGYENILVVGGSQCSWEDSSIDKLCDTNILSTTEIIKITKDCPTPDETNCEWKKSDDIPNRGITNGAMVTMNGIPYLFGGLSSFKSTIKDVYKFDVNKENGNKWEKLSKTMMTPREGHSVVVVPESFITNVPEMDCNKFDSRGYHWAGEFETWVNISCPEGKNPGGISYARWFCDGQEKDFVGEQPDRSECYSEWINDVQEMINNGGDIIKISEIISNMSQSSHEGKLGMTGGDVIKVTGLVDTLVQKQSQEEVYNSFEGSVKFSENMFNTTNSLFLSNMGWKEIASSSQRYQASSNLLAAVDSIGYMLTQSEVKDTNDCHSLEQYFLYEAVKVKVTSQLLVDINSKDNCHAFGNTSICIPENILENIEKDCIVNVATFFDITQEMFPSNKIEDIELDEEREIYIHNGVMGLTINNNSNPIIRDDISAPIVITFTHEDRNESYCQRYCIFWDFDEESWSSRGCSLSSDNSDSTHTTCHCNHLTNFGVMFDITGSIDPNDPILDPLTNVLLTISILAVVATQVILGLQRDDSRSFSRKTVEDNRNWALVAAQMVFLIQGPLAPIVPAGFCVFLGLLGHFLWLVVFSWTALEGYFFYRALVTVFETGRLYTAACYGLAYGVSFTITIITVIISETRSSGSFYVKTLDCGEVTMCFLNSEGYAVLALVIPILLVVIGNTGVTIIAVTIAYKSGGRSNLTTQNKVLRTIYNTLLLSGLLGLTWIFGIFASFSKVMEYFFVILNGLSGVYILIYSVGANQKVRTDFKKKMKSIRSKTSLDQLDGKSKSGQTTFYTYETTSTT